MTYWRWTLALERIRTALNVEVQPGHSQKIELRCPVDWSLPALMLQGFDEKFYLNCKESGISNNQIYKQAGNAVSVNTVYAVLDYLIFDQLITN